MSGPCADCGGPDYQTLVVRITELEADKETADLCIEHLSLDNERMEADLAEESRQADEAVGSCRTRIAELEAERDALRDRRCEGCEHVRHHAVGKPSAYRLCALGNAYGYDPALPDDFACNRWQPRGGGGG